MALDTAIVWTAQPILPSGAWLLNELVNCPGKVLWTLKEHGELSAYNQRPLS